VPFQGDDPVG